MRPDPWWVAYLVAVIAVAACPAAAQNESFVFVSSNPGARSRALGGAFAGLADDATAALANPAGLVQLIRPEISIETRFTLSDSTASAFDADSNITGLGFASFVWPLRHWAAAAYVHKVSSADFLAGAIDPMNSKGFNVTSVAVAGAWRPMEKLSLGLGVTSFTGDLRGPGVAEDQTATDWGVNAGVLWSPTPALNLGAFYRQGPRMEFRSTTVGDPRLPLSLPDVSGIGIALRPGAGRVALGFEWDRVDYSGLLVAVDGSLVRATVEDVDEFHIGVEYVVLEWSPVTAFRLGAWREPGRRGTIVDAATPAGRLVVDDDEVHLAGGFGLAWRRFQFDFGFDHSHRDDTVSLSMIVSF